MTPERFREVDRLVNLVLDHPELDRAALLDGACAGDVELRAAVDSFLDSKEKLGDFLAQPPSELAGDLLASGPLASGVRLGRYVIRERIGGGGMGVVYAAYDPELDRRVALKLVSPAVAGTGDENQGARLLREAQAMARLSHPNVMPVYDMGTFGDQVFIAMEYVEGNTLTEWLAEPKRHWRDIVSMFVQAGRGLAAAHAAGLFHRDFKPNNVLVGMDGRARVLDFGLARSAQPDKSAELDVADGRAPADTKSTPRLAMLGVTVTQQGKFVGTPAYMAPEQLMGERADERTDQYSFCVALYQGLYDELPFNAENFTSLPELVGQRRVKEAPNATSVPLWLRQILLRGLNPNPADRYSSMEVLLDELVRHRALPRRRSVILWGVAVAGLLVLAALGFRFLTNFSRGVTPVKSVAVLPFANVGSEPDNEYLISHNHNIYYRFDFDINGSANNAVDKITLQPSLDPSPDTTCATPGQCFTDVQTQLLNETVDYLDPTVYTSWRIYNKATFNANGRTIGYELVPDLQGLWSGMVTTNEPWSSGELWVTRYNGCHLLAFDNHPPHIPGVCAGTEDNVTEMVAGAGSIDGEDVVVWYANRFRHFPRDEDQDKMPIEYMSFTIQPRSFFHHNPVEP